MAETTTQLLESHSFATAPATRRVDREKGIIYGVKLVGLESPSHHRRYTADALRNAVTLYEGVSVSINHPPVLLSGKHGEYDTRGGFGCVRGVRPEADGLYGDLHYLKSHVMAEPVCEAAERMPSLYSFSHHADASGSAGRDGWTTYTKVASVTSLDLVYKGGTTKGLFEAENTMKTTVKQLLESLAAKLDPARRDRMPVVLLESPLASYHAVELDPPAETVAAEDAVRSVFESLQSAAIADAALDAPSKTKRVRELAVLESKLFAPAVTAQTPAPLAAAVTTPDEKQRLAALETELAGMRRKNHVRTLCETAKIDADAVLLESLYALPDDAAVSRVLEREKIKGRVQTPRTSGGNGGGATPPVAPSVNDAYVAMRGGR